VAPGYIFDVSLGQSSSNIWIESITIEHLRGTGNMIVDVFATNYGSFEGKLSINNDALHLQYLLIDS
jgi:hypothetical protein